MKQLLSPWPLSVAVIYLRLSLNLSPCSICPFGPSSCPCDHTNKPNSSSSRQPSGELNLILLTSLKEKPLLFCSGKHLASPQTFPKGFGFKFLHPHAHSHSIIPHVHLLLNLIVVKTLNMRSNLVTHVKGTTSLQGQYSGKIGRAHV